MKPALAVISLIALTSCSDRPKAPPLTDEAVFRNDRIGLRFLAPSGWVLQSRATFPDGRLAKPIILVSYQGAGGEKQADFKLLVADLSPDADLEEFLVGYRVGSEVWTPRPPAEQIAVNGAQASRFLFIRKEVKDEIRREATAFRRGERVYFFLVVFAASDAASRDAVRTAVGSVTWTK
jgi:hypothetical protein